MVIELVFPNIILLLQFFSCILFTKWNRIDSILTSCVKSTRTELQIVWTQSLVRVGYTSLHHQTLHTPATYVFEPQYTINSFLKDLNIKHYIATKLLALKIMTNYFKYLPNFVNLSMEIPYKGM